jgi:hypothetical protein
MAADIPSDVIAYVRSSALLLDLKLDDAQIGRVALHLARTQGIATLLRHVPLGPEDELAEVFRPAPFPSEDVE